MYYLGSCWGRRSEYEYSALVLSFFPSVVVTRRRLRGVSVVRGSRAHLCEQRLDVVGGVVDHFALDDVVVLLGVGIDVGQAGRRRALVGLLQLVCCVAESAEEAEQLADDDEHNLHEDDQPPDTPVQLCLERRILARVGHRQHRVGEVVHRQPDHDAQDEPDVAPEGNVPDDRQRSHLRQVVRNHGRSGQQDRRDNHQDEPSRPPHKSPPAFVRGCPLPPVERAGEDEHHQRGGEEHRPPDGLEVAGDLDSRPLVDGQTRSRDEPDPGQSRDQPPQWAGAMPLAVAELALAGGERQVSCVLTHVHEFTSFRRGFLRRAVK